MTAKERYMTDEAYAHEIVLKIAEMRAEGLTHAETDAILDLPMRSVQIWNGVRGRYLRIVLDLDARD